MSLSVKGQESTFDLRELSLGDACRLGSWVRDLETVGKSSEEVCQLIAMSLARSFCSQATKTDGCLRLMGTTPPLKRESLH